ncbi:MAG: hypothetical protein F6K50_47475 [Moorea sp. SIO3I7]|nr:hypothetical protein [Moorena sp. SIO3I7]
MDVITPLPKPFAMISDLEMGIVLPYYGSFVSCATQPRLSESFITLFISFVKYNLYQVQCDYPA